MSDPDQSQMVVCSQCGREIPAPDALTLEWAKAKFCSGDCREAWTRNANRRLR